MCVAEPEVVALASERMKWDVTKPRYEEAAWPTCLVEIARVETRCDRSKVMRHVAISDTLHELGLTTEIAQAYGTERF